MRFGFWFCGVFFYYRTICANPGVFLRRYIQLWVLCGALLELSLNLFPEQHRGSWQCLSPSSLFLSEMRSLCWFHSSGKGLSQHSSTFQRGCDGVHPGSPAQHSFVWGYDGADLYIGPICDALTGW